MNILNVGYGIAKPQARFHLVQSNVSLRLEDPRNDDKSTASIELKTGSGLFGQSSNNDWKLSSSNASFTIACIANNNTCNVLFANSKGDIIVANDIYIGGAFIKNGRDIIADTYDYIISSNEILKTDYDRKFQDTTEYILNTSNTISTRITNLNADSIADGNINKFIINNKYENDLEIIGDLKASNLTIYGENTILYTDVYTTEQLTIDNKGLGTALTVKQSNTSYSIFNASNNTTEVFTILNNGNIGIGTCSQVKPRRFPS